MIAIAIISAPQIACEMCSVPLPELRVAGDDQEDAVPEHRPDRAHEEHVEAPAEVDAAQREPRT